MIIKVIKRLKNFLSIILKMLTSFEENFMNFCQTEWNWFVTGFFLSFVFLIVCGFLQGEIKTLSYNICIIISMSLGQGLLSSFVGFILYIFGSQSSEKTEVCFLFNFILDAVIILFLYKSFGKMKFHM